MINDNKSLGKVLKQRRIMIPLTLGELSAKSGVSQSYLSRIEAGGRFPSARILCKIAKPLRCSESELFTFADYLPSQSSRIVESEAQLERLDPNVVRALSQEPVELQLAMLAIFSTLKYMTEVIAQKNSGNGTKGAAGTDSLNPR